MSMSSVLSATVPPEFPGRSPSRAAHTRAMQRAYDAALPKDHANVQLTSWLLQYTYKGKPLLALQRAFTTRNASRYQSFLRVCSFILVVASVLFVLYDVLRFKGNTSTMNLLIIIRFCVIIPAAAAILAYTYSRFYLEHPHWLLVPCFVFGMGMVAYSVIGDDPGYGTLAMMIVFTYSFTPITFFYCSALSFVFIVTFCSLLFLFSDKESNELFTVVGMLALFWAAVAFVGHNLEGSLRRSFLDEVVVRRQRDQLGVEKRLSDQLLANMLPRQIAAQLKEGRHVVADEFEAVTVLFCEICDWGTVTDSISADNVVTILNRIYSRFDRLIERCNVYKVETVGEVYMVVGGCPTRTTTHAADCVRMALAMMDAMPTLRNECENIVGSIGRTLQIRIGLNSGPIVAGIVGIKNPRYKLFGDTVNTASRMESTSLPGKVQISDKTYPYVKDLYQLAARGPIKVKGKGMMSTYFVEGPLDDPMVGAVVSSVESPARRPHGSPQHSRKHSTGRSPLRDEAGQAPLRKHHSAASMGSHLNSSHGNGANGSPPQQWSGSGSELVGSHTSRHNGSRSSSGGRGDGKASEDGPPHPHALNISSRRIDPMPAPTPHAAEFFSGHGAAAAQAARELYAPTPDLGDKQHLVDIFRRHMDSDWASDNDDDHPGANTRDFVVTYDESERSQQPGQAPPTVHMYSQPPEPRLPLGGGPSESGRIPSFTISRARSSGNDADNARASDLHVEDIVSGADSRVDVFEDTKAEPMADDVDTSRGPNRTFSGKRPSLPSNGVVSGSHLTKLVSISDDKPNATGGGGGTRTALGSPMAKRTASPPTFGGSNASNPQQDPQSSRSLRQVIPADTLGLTQPRRRHSGTATLGLSGVWRRVRSVPREAGRAVCLYRPSDTRLGSMEVYYLKEYMPTWRRFMRISCALCIVALGLFAIQDLFTFDRGMDSERKRHDIIIIIRYAVLVPVVLLYLLLTRLQRFKAEPMRSYWLVQGLSVVIVLVVGAGIIAVSVVGTEPGFGVLGAYIVFCFNITLIAYAYRAAALFLLVVAHMVSIVVFNELRGFEVMEQLGYLCVFYLGQGLPVLGREYYNRENYIRREKLAVQKKQLKLETERTDRLLENLLPRAIARQLKDGAKCIAGHFDMATILFTDMRGFTNFSANITPSQLVGFLNTMYSKFDMIATKYGIHKVEIIGDAYFSVAGCPSTMPDHAERCCAAALEMLEYMPELRRRAGADITMRVGIHAGPLVAGVVGVKDPRYHLFGNTVNLAMAMESNGIPGKVHISSEAYQWLQHRLRDAKEHPENHKAFRKLAGDIEFAFEPREPMHILGHDDVQTYILSRRMTSSRNSSSSTYR